jgi:hypothetical protein
MVNTKRLAHLPNDTAAHWMNLAELENGDQQVEIGLGQACGI